MVQRILTSGLILLTAALALPSVAGATPVATLTSPSTGDCIGGNEPMGGTADWDQFNPASGWTLTATREDSGVIIDQATSPQPRIGTLTGFDTTDWPTGVTIRLFLEVRADNSVASDQRTFLPTYDRIKPRPVDVNRSLATSGRQFWLLFGSSLDQGCSGTVSGYTTSAEDVVTGQVYSLSLPHQTDTNGVSGKDGQHEVLGAAALTAGRTYRVWATAYDGNGVASEPGIVQYLTTANHYDTVIAGQVRGLNNGVTRLSGIPVTTKRTDGTVMDRAMTSAGGWYSSRVAQGVSSYRVAYGPGCTFAPAPICAQDIWQTPEDDRSAPADAGRIQNMPRNLLPSG